MADKTSTCYCEDCDWREYRMHLIESMKNIQEAIKELHAELSIVHLELKKANGKKKALWSPWKYVLLGAGIALPSQVILEVTKVFILSP